MSSSVVILRIDCDLHTFTDHKLQQNDEVNERLSEIIIRNKIHVMSDMEERIGFDYRGKKLCRNKRK